MSAIIAMLTNRLPARSIPLSHTIELTKGKKEMKVLKVINLKARDGSEKGRTKTVQTSGQHESTANLEKSLRRFSKGGISPPFSMSIARDKFNGRRTSNHLEAKFPWKADWGSASKLPGPLRFLAHHCRYSRNSEATTPLSFVTFTSRPPTFSFPPSSHTNFLLHPQTGSGSPTLTPLSIGAFKRKIQKYTKPKPIPQLSSSSPITDDYRYQGVRKSAGHVEGGNTF
ncbi:hypothetical protein V1478_011896 [Vespula squamosa]|uniref:Uncharacterized protein n=1 Tax=Vespula squamosa TaxID=30214 RepID=A0ABD2ABU1_VESSQ